MLIWRWSSPARLPVNAITCQQISIRDNRRDGSSLTDMANDLLDVRVQQRFATAQRDDSSA